MYEFFSIPFVHIICETRPQQNLQNIMLLCKVRGDLPKLNFDKNPRNAKENKYMVGARINNVFARHRLDSAGKFNPPSLDPIGWRKNTQRYCIFDAGGQWTHDSVSTHELLFSRSNTFYTV
jgi:hypothetical protein